MNTVQTLLYCLSLVSNDLFHHLVIKLLYILGTPLLYIKHPHFWENGAFSLTEI